MKALILSISLAALAIGSAGCTVVGGHPHRYYYDEPDVIIVGPPHPHYYYYGPPRYYGPPGYHEYRFEDRR